MVAGIRFNLTSINCVMALVNNQHEPMILKGRETHIKYHTHPSFHPKDIFPDHRMEKNRTWVDTNNSLDVCEKPILQFRVATLTRKWMARH